MVGASGIRNSGQNSYKPKLSIAGAAWFAVLCLIVFSILGALAFYQSNSRMCYIKIKADFISNSEPINHSRHGRRATKFFIPKKNSEYTLQRRYFEYDKEAHILTLRLHYAKSMGLFLTEKEICP